MKISLAEALKAPGDYEYHTAAGYLSDSRLRVMGDGSSYWCDLSGPGKWEQRTYTTNYDAWSLNGTEHKFKRVGYAGSKTLLLLEKVRT